MRKTDNDNRMPHNAALGATGALRVNDNTDDAEPQMIQNARVMVEEHERDVQRNQLNISL